jgi:hypothetical protein
MKKNANEELIEKALESSSFFAGGAIQPTQQAEFVRLVKDFSVLLQRIRFVEMPTPQYIIDKIHLGEPITRGIGENSNAATNPVSPKFNQLTLSTTKTKSYWYITTEAIQNALNQDNIEDTMMEMAAKRIATDLELLFIQGDSTITGTTPLDELLKVKDGIDKLSDSAHIVDAGANYVSDALWSEMIRRMPEQYLQDPDLRFMVSRMIWLDYQETRAKRETDLGDRGLQGEVTGPFGIPVIIAPLIPSNKSITIVADNPVNILGAEFGPFEILTGVNDKLLISVNGDDDVTVTLPQGVYLPVEIANILNTYAGLSATVSRDSGDGRLLIQSRASGADQTIELKTVELSAYAELGLTVGLYTGADVGKGGSSLNQGSIIMLTNPMNLIFGMLDQTRVYSEFKKDFDRVEVVIYNQIENAIENLDSIVKAINVRRKLA